MARHACRAGGTPIIPCCPPSLWARCAQNGHGGCSRRSATMMDPRAMTAIPASSAPCGCPRRMLLVHGFLATPHVFRWLAARLGRSGYCVHGVDLGGLFGRFNARPIEELAHVVAERVEQLARDHPCERIDLVGHSAGGLIGRYYVQKLDGVRHVRHLVTLGTPHRGTRWAYPGHLVRRVLPSLRQMAPGSPLLRDLADDDFPAGVRLTSVYSRRDSICPPSSCRLEIGQAPHLRNVEVTRGGHLELLLSARVSSIVRRELESEESLVSARPRLTWVGSPRPPAMMTSRGRRRDRVLRVRSGDQPPAPSRRTIVTALRERVR